MRVFVINLPGDTERRASAAAQLEAAGVNFDFFQAIRGDEAPQRCPFDACDQGQFFLNTGRNITSAEIGCFASHRALWTRAVSLREPVVVLEDDFQLRDNFAAALRTAARVIHQLGFLRLQNDLRARTKALTHSGDFFVSRYTKAPHGTMGYAIAPEVASHFLSLSQTMEAPVDVFIKKFWEHGQPLYALLPYPVVSSPLSKISTIRRPPKQRKPVPVAARRFLRKTRWQIRRIAFNLGQFRSPIDFTAGAAEKVLDIGQNGMVREQNRRS